MSNNHVIGLDIGGTKVQASLFETQNSSRSTLKEIDTKRIPTQRDKGYKDTLCRTAALIKDVLGTNDLSPTDLIGIGIGLPGSVHPETQVMLNGNTEIFKGQDFVNDLEKELGARINIKCTNDANCFALAEAYKGAGLKYSEQTGLSLDKTIGIGIILGTGTGGGTVYHGKVLGGSIGGGSEFGHLSLVNARGTSDKTCYCGHKGCAELYLSGTGIEDNYQASHPNKLKKPSIEIFRDAQNKSDDLSVIAISNYKENLKNFLVQLTRSYDPHYFVLGGGVSLQDSIYEELESRVQAETFVPESMPRVYRHQVSDSAGALGAAMIVIN